MKVLKFGGSSVANADRIREVARIIKGESRRERIIVVVSAFQGVTNQLLEAARRAESGNAGYEKLCHEIIRRHLKIIDDLCGRKKQPIHTSIDRELSELRDVLQGIALLRHAAPRALDLVASFGERLSASIISAYLNRTHPSTYVDARSFTITDDQFTHASVLFDQTNPRIRSFFKKMFAPHRKNLVPVVTGFIGATDDGRTTTIGRNGSDYSAAILGAALNASVIEIWTDVDGVLSADPRIVKSAFVLPQVSYEEAMELSYFGATVLHSASIAPAVAGGIPILIKNTLNPTAPGTLVSKQVTDWEGVAKGITSVDGITLLTLRGMSMVGVPGTAERLFRSLATNNVNVILISQASSEHTICFAVRTSDATTAKNAMTGEFRYEFHTSLTRLDERPSQTIIAIVGDGMKGTPGVSGKVFQALGINNINISAIAQGASERNISFVINSTDAVRTLNVVHEAFFEKRKRLGLVIVGIGNIGSALLTQLEQQHSFLLSRGFDVRVVGVGNSKRYVLSTTGMRQGKWIEALGRSSSRMNPAKLAREISTLGLTNAALVDCTASPAVVEAYPEFVKANLHIITPNKKANVLPSKQYDELMELLRHRQKYFLYEANVGAGLPVISTLNDLIASGDTIIKIEGILSGTLSYLFNTYDGTQRFSECVREAHRLGYTEPDPRDDLSGHDVARKLLILGRQLGWRMDLGNIRSQNLVPPSLRRCAFNTGFYKSFARADQAMQQRYKRAQAKGQVLRYVGTLKDKTGSARLQEFPSGHPFAGIKGSDNVIIFTTKRYSRTPLVVQGPGAGADVTAMGVFSDILKLLHYLPH